MILTIDKEESTRKVFEFSRKEIDKILLIALGLEGQDCTVNIGSSYAVISVTSTTKKSSDSIEMPLS